MATIRWLAIMVAVVGFNLFADGLRDALDPISRNRLTDLRRSRLLSNDL